MTLTQLVNLRTRLKKFTMAKLTSSVGHLGREISSWNSLATDGNIREDVDFLIRTFESIDCNAQSFDTLLNELLLDIEKEIANKSAIFLQHGYTINGIKALGPTYTAEEDRVYRQRPISHDFAIMLGSRIKKFTDWRFPTVEIGPGDGFWTDNLVGSDPLYLIDIHREYLDKTLSKFLESYSKKLRPYLIGSEAKTSYTDLSCLPNNQIGFIFSWQVFDYLSFSETEQYLTNCVTKLRPGGSMIFSFNNCDHYMAASAAEKGQRSWLNEELLTQILNKLKIENFAIYSSEDNYWHWVEFDKPGKKCSIKTHQPQYKVHRRAGFEIVDTEPERHYNKQQIARLKQIAIKMGIDDEESIMADKYPPRELEKIINIARMNK